MSNNQNTKRPNAFAEWLLKKIVNDEKESPAGDFEEYYNYLINEKSKMSAYFWYINQIIILAACRFKSIIWRSTAMFKNYLKIAFRNLIKYKGYSFINILGLSVGLSIFILASLVAAFEFSYESFHDNADRIYGVVQEFPSTNMTTKRTAVVPAPLFSALVREFPEIEDATRFFRADRKILKRENEIFYDNKMFFVDPNFLSFFTFKMKEGDSATALSRPNTMVITETTAQKYFGDENPIGRSLTLDNRIDVTVTGILEDIPLNSGIRFNFLVSMETARILYDWMDDWDTDSQSVFILLPEDHDPGQLEDKLPVFLNNHFESSKDSPERLFLMPLCDFHSESEKLKISSFMVRDVPYEILFWFLAMAAGLLVVVCINFVNLSTARYTTRMKEVGMRKVIGGNRTQLVKQFLGESALMSLLSLPLAVILFEFLRPRFITLMNYDMDIVLWHYPVFAVILIAGTLLLGIIAGIYPAFYLTAFSPVQVFKTKISNRNKGSRFRKILIVFQFSMSILFIIFTYTVRTQIDYISNFNFGYNLNNVLVVPLIDETHAKMELLKSELIKRPDITYVSSSVYMPFHWKSERQVVPEGFDKEGAWTMSVYGVDYDFIKTLDMKIQLGRSFSMDFSDENSFIINETAVNLLKWTDPIGKEITYDNRKGKIIGVVRDFQFYDLHDPMNPTVLYLAPEKSRFMLVKFSSQTDAAGVTEYLEEQWKFLIPDFPIEYSTLKNEFDDGYNYITIMASTCSVFGDLAIFISCLGLLGLASFSVLRKTKEIGVRKVLGANVPGIIKMLLSEFMFLVALSNLISIPASYYFVNIFLQYAWTYNAGVQIWSCILAGALTFTAAVLAVFYQTYTAAAKSPVDSLRYE